MAGASYNGIDVMCFMRCLVLPKSSLACSARPMSTSRPRATACFAFAKYADHNRCNANSAFNALNKWLHANFSNDIVIHGFRHAMRHRLKAVICPSEMIDQIGEWSSGKIGEDY